MESLMDSALLNDQFHVEYQPFKDIISGEIIGAEALLRWESPILGRIPPQQFIGVAEQSGLIHELGYFVLRTAIEQVAYWNSNFNKDFYIAVNLSPIQFKDERLPKKIEELLKFYKVSPKSLEIELTESVFFDDQEKILESLNEMNELGIDISLDDFGTGFSSLSYLAKFPFSTVKIDSSFIKNVEHSDKSRKLVSAIISMANSLGLLVVAEGIENLQQANFVKEQKADTWQGYYFGKPVKSVDFVESHFK
jgi:EAL domain-containing protein (putative c-di-GMP-specific phosphodiesterase class I)